MSDARTQLPETQLSDAGTQLDNMKESDVFIVKLTFCKNGDNPAFAIEGKLYRYFAFEDGDTDEYVFRPLNMDNENANYDRGYLRFAEFSDYTVFEFVFHEVADSDSNVTYTREMTEYVGEPCRVEIISRIATATPGSGLTTKLLF